MELTQLRYFIESAENENFSLTAKHNFLPASAVSASVKKLEDELGCKLFDRSANKIKLNQNGRVFAAAVNDALSMLDSAKAALTERQNEISGDISLLIRTERSLITEKIIEFRALYPGVTFHLTHTFTKTDYTDYDIIIDELTGKYSGFKQEPLISERVRIAASRKNPLCTRQLILNDLRNCSFITMSRGSSLANLTERLCRSAGFLPHIVIESDDPLYIRRYIAKDFGIAFYPERSWEGERGDDIVFLDVKDLDVIRTTYVYFKSSNAIRAARAFYEYLTENMN